MPTLKEKILAKKIEKLEVQIFHLFNDTVLKCRYNDLLDNNMYQEAIIEDLKEQVAVLKTRRPDIYLKSEFDNMKTRLEVFERIKEENKKLKEEQFDNMEEIAKRDGMCLVDIHIFDKLVEEEEENKKLKEEIKRLEEENQINRKPILNGKFHKDKRITVKSCDDRAEYNRQVMYIRHYPECEVIPKRKWTKKPKQGSSSDIQTEASL